MATVSFHIGLSSAKASATASGAGALYFETDTNLIKRYDGNEWVTYGGNAVSPVVVVETDPSTPAQGTLYVNTTDKTLKIYTGSSTSSGILLGQEVTLAVAATESAASNTKIPTEKAVRKAIEDKFGTTEGLAPVLDANGHLPTSVIPHYNISEYQGSKTTKAQLATLSAAEVGDFATVSEGADAGLYVLTGSYDSVDNWIKLDQDTYELPTASSSTKGGVRIGSHLTMSGDVLNADYSVATASADGLMSSADKSKLDGLATVATSGSYNDLTTKLEWTDHSSN